MEVVPMPPAGESGTSLSPKNEYDNRVRRGARRRLGGYGILRGTAIAPSPVNGTGRMQSPEDDDKENVPPPGDAGSARLQARRNTNKKKKKKKKMLCCHQRRPLRDITAFVNAMDRRRINLRATAARQRNRDIDPIPPSISLDSPLHQEPSAPKETSLDLSKSFCSNMVTRELPAVKLEKRLNSARTENTRKETVKKLKRSKTLMSMR